MKKCYLLILAFAALFLSQTSFGQVLNPNDPVITYNPATPPATPPFDSIGKWVRTVDLPWNSTQYKCYYYRGMQFRLLFPKTWTPTTTKIYPMVVFLHGLGERGTIYDNELQMRWEGLTFLNAVNSGAFDGFVLYPQNTGGFWGINYYQDIIHIINYMVVNSKLDLNRVFMSGLSAGGDGDWQFTTLYPQYVACAEIISSCYLGLESYIPNPLKFIPVWLSQGGLDGSPSPYTTQQIVNDLNSYGAPLTYTVYPGYGHGVWDIHYAEPDAFPYYNRANKVNPIVFFGQTLFCPSDTNNIHVTLGLCPGFNGYQWRKNGIVIPGATADTLNVTSLGTYDARFMRGSTWTYWSPTPVVIGIKPPTQTPNIALNGHESDYTPAPDGSNSVTLTLPSGYKTYSWTQQGNNTVLDTTQDFTTSTPGNYIALVQEFGGCSSLPSAPFTVENANGPNPPSPASNVVGFAPTQSSIKLNWTVQPDPTYLQTGFEIYRGTNSGGPYQFIGIAPGDSSGYLDQNLSANTKYYYLVRAIDSTAASTTTPQVMLATSVDTIPPSAPGNLRVTQTSRTSVSLAWSPSTDNVSVSQYWIYKNGSRSFITTGTTFNVFNLVTGNTYYFTVKAVDPTGNLSLNSNQVSAIAQSSGLNYSLYTTTTSWLKLPNFNTFFRARATGHSTNVNLNITSLTQNFGILWTGYIRIPVGGNYTFGTNSDDGSALYIGAPYNYADTPVVNNDGQHGPTLVTGNITLAAGTYPVSIAYFQAIGGQELQIFWESSALGLSSLSPIPDSAFTDGDTLSGSLPLAPTQIHVSPLSYKALSIHWQDNSSNETGFEIYRSTVFGGPYSIVYTTKANITSYIDSTLNPSTTYFYKVRAINTNGNSGFDIASVNDLSFKYYTTATPWSQLPDFNALTPDSSGTINNINLNSITQITNFGYLWSGYISIPVSGTYTLGTASDDGSKLYINTPYSYGATALVNNDGLHGITQVSSNITLNQGVYPIEVTYFQQGGGYGMTAYWEGAPLGISTPVAIPDSAFVNPNMFATTLVAPPAPPVPYSVDATGVSAAKIQVQWSDSLINVSGFQIYRSIADSNHYSLLAQIPFANTANYSYADSGLYENTVYFYKIQAMNSVNVASAYSIQDSALTEDIPPVVLPLRSFTMRYDTVYNVNVTAVTSSSDKLTLTAQNLPSFATFTDYTDGTGLIHIAPTSSSQRGVYSNITIVAQDQHGGTGSQSFTLTVNDNFAPVLEYTPVVTMNAGNTLLDTINVYMQNARDNVTYVINGLPSFATFNPISVHQAVFTFKPGYANAGSYSIEVIATDKYGEKDDEFITLNVGYVNPSRSWDLNMSYQTLASAPWDNITGISSSNLPDVNGNPSTLGLNFQVPSWTAFNSGAVTGNNSGVYPDSVIQDCYFFGALGAPNVVQAQLTGLDTTRTYNITFFGSSNWNGVANNGHTIYQVGSKVDSLEVQNNSSQTLTFSNIKPASDGTLSFTMSKGSDAAVGYLNSLVITSSFDDGNPPAPPTNLSAQNNSGRGVLLKWTVNSYNTAVGFEIYRADSLTGTYSLLDPNPTNGTDTTYIDSTTTGNSSYVYTMRAINSHGNSAYSDTVSVSTLPTTPIITGIGNISLKYGTVDTLNFVATADSLSTITLSASGLPGFASFQDLGGGNGQIILTPGSQDVGDYNGISVYALTNSGGQDTVQLNITVKNKYFNPIYINLTDGIQTEGSPWNNLGFFAIQGANVANLQDANGLPTGISITNLDTWTGTFQAGNLTYNNSGIYPDTVIQIYYFQSDTTAKRLQVSGLQPNTRYNFSFYGSSIYGDNFPNYTTHYTIGNQTVTLNAYRNRTKTVRINGIIPDSSGTLTIYVQADTASLGAVLNALVIESYDSSSNLVLPPTNLTATTFSTKQVNLAWQDHAFNETGYAIQRATSLAGPYTQVGTSGLGTTTYSDTSVTLDTRYFYKVQAEDTLIDSVSDFSNIASTTTPAFSIYVNFNGGGPQPPKPWNNTRHNPTAGDTYGPFLDSNGNNTGISANFPSNYEGEANVGVQTGNNSGIYPDNVLLGEYYLDNGLDTIVMVIQNLDLSMKYNFVFFGSLAGHGWNSTTIFVNNTNMTSLAVCYNSTQTTEMDNLSPDQSGQITIKMVNAYNTPFAILGAMVIHAHDNFDNNGNLISNQPQAFLLRKPGTWNFGNNANSDFLTYPNPFHNVVRLAVPVHQGDGTYQVNVYNLEGQRVYTQNLGVLPEGLNAIQLDLSGQHLTNGSYIVRIDASGRTKGRSTLIIRQ